MGQQVSEAPGACQEQVTGMNERPPTAAMRFCEISGLAYTMGCVIFFGYVFGYVFGSIASPVGKYVNALMDVL